MKTISKVRFVILELGFTPAYTIIHHNHIRTVIAARGAGCLIRIAKSCTGADNFAFDGIDALIRENGIIDIPLNTLCFCIECEKPEDGFAKLCQILANRYQWIANWDDPKNRRERYF